MELDYQITEQMLEALIADTIFSIAGVKIEDKNQHLFDASVGIIPADYLYVIQELENKLQYPVAKIFEKHDYTVFTIQNLAKEIIRELPENPLGMRDAVMHLNHNDV